jgi:lysophospholipase L1-like esterase
MDLMRRMGILVALGFCALAGVARAQSAITEKPITEKVEWTWTDRPDAPAAALPNVLLVGDSITRAYYPATEKELSGVANVYLFATSCASGDPRLPGQLRDYFAMMGLKFAVIHFNNGMHGWGYTEQQYAAGLPGKIAVLRDAEPQARLVWADTTPVRRDSATGQASNARIDERNRLAAAVMSREGIPTDDQHGLMLPHADMHSDDVHFNAEGSAMEAAQVAGIIRLTMGKR